MSAVRSHARTPQFDCVDYHKMMSFATCRYFGFSGCKPAAEERRIRCNRPGWCMATVMAYEVWYRAWADQPSPVRSEQVPNLIGRWSNPRSLWYRAGVFHEVVLAIYFHASIDDQCAPVPTPRQTPPLDCHCVGGILGRYTRQHCRAEDSCYRYGMICHDMIWYDFLLIRQSCNLERHFAILRSRHFEHSV